VTDLLDALRRGDVEAVVATLAPDVVFVNDGGPTRRAARRPVLGSHRVARMLGHLAARSGEADVDVEVAVVNGDPAVVGYKAGAVDFVTVFEVIDGRVARIWSVVNPTKLAHLCSHGTLR
jgi:RNA polymerase sigma-70 factor (ECF subfamily)